jgi:hypothetical protein
MKRISKKVREEAALLCALAASNHWHGARPHHPQGPIPPKDSEAGRLAYAAEKLTWSIWRKSPLWTSEAHWAEAEALLRCGWTP